MSAKTLIIATAALAASTAMTLPAFAAGGDGTGPAGNPPPAATNAPARPAIMFNLLDTNKDGAIDKDEYAVLSTTIFESLDTNKDGKLTQDELNSRFGAMFGGRGGRGGPGWQDRDDRGGWGGGPGMGRGPGRGGPGMGRMGFNGDGPQGPGPRLSFNDIDTNHDGVISADEFQAHLPAPGQGPGFGRRW